MDVERARVVRLGASRLAHWRKAANKAAQMMLALRPDGHARVPGHLIDTGVDRDRFAKQYSPVPIGKPRYVPSFLKLRDVTHRKPTNHPYLRIAMRLRTVEQNVVNIVLKSKA